MILDDVYNAWYPVKKRQVKPGTIACYSLIYIKILQPDFGHREIKELDKHTIKEFILGLLEDRGLSKRYCGDILIVFKMLIQFACDELDADIPNISWKMVWPTMNKLGKKQLERYTPTEYKKIVDYAIANPSPRNMGILLTLCTGMRIGELCALQWKDIDFEQKVIHISKTLERVYEPEKRTTHIEIGTPKTISSDRYVPIMKNIFPIIKKFASVSLPDYYVCTCSPKYVEPRNLATYYKKFIMEEVKLDHCIKFHGLRHTFASTLIENNVDVKTTSSILGHSDVSTTLNIYVHPSDDAKRDAMKNGLKKIFK